MSQPTFDPKSQELAEYFLEGSKIHSPTRVRELAQCIQDTIEQQLEMWEEEGERQKGDDDGVEYGDPSDELADRLNRD